MLKKKKPVKDLSCLNCETQFDGWFCPNCGQKAHTKRLTIVQVIADFMDALTDSEKGFLRTFIDLSQNPAQMLNDYIAGKRKRYLSAAKYTFLLVILFTINISMLEHHYQFFRFVTNKIETLTVHFDEKKDSDEKPKGNKEEYKDAKGVIKVKGSDDVLIKFSLWDLEVDKTVTEKQLLEFIKNLLPEYHRSLFNFLKFFLVLWIPVFSFFSFLIFRKSGFNMAEHLAINSYIYAHILLIFIVFSPAYWLLPKLAITTFNVTFVAALFYLFFSYMQVFAKGRFQLVRTSIALVSAYSTYLTILIILMGIQVIYVGILNIERLQ